jgi:hypothetical protein
MGFWKAVTGRRDPVPARLDSLFEVPSAAVILQTETGFVPTGTGSVCYRGATGAAFAQTQQDALDLLKWSSSAPDVEVMRDSFGFTWLTVSGDPADPSGLCTDLHAVNTTLEAAGFGSGLLCTLIPFRDPSDRKLGLVYLYKQGTYYAFAPTGPQQRDNLLELQVRDVLSQELPMEQDLTRWLALWDAPGL